MSDIRQSARQQRRDQLLHGTGNYWFGPDLVDGFIASARVLLAAASAEASRFRDTDWARENYPSQHGPGAIVLTVTAFECFLNDTVHNCLFILPGRDPELEALVKKDDFFQKFTDLPHLVSGSERLENHDLWMVHEVRNELVHSYPRHVGTTSHVPDWLQMLAEKGLLVRSPSKTGDFGWQTKLQSFRLAAWCPQVIARAAEQFAAALQGISGGAGSVASTALNEASHFRTLLLPSQS